MINLQHLSQVTISGIPVLNLDIPNGGGIFANGFLSLIGTILSVVFSLLLLIWVFYSMYAAYKIIKSQGESKGIEEGVGIIKNIWVTISVMIIFFIILAFAGSMFGFGSVYDWSQNLAQCGPNGPFYFQQVEQQREFLVAHGGFTKGAIVYCCPISADHEYSDDLGSLTLRKGYNWLMIPANSVANAAFIIAVDKTTCQSQTYTINE